MVTKIGKVFKKFSQKNRSKHYLFMHFLRGHLFEFFELLLLIFSLELVIIAIQCFRGPQRVDVLLGVKSFDFDLFRYLRFEMDKIACFCRHKYFY